MDVDYQKLKYLFKLNRRIGVMERQFLVVIINLVVKMIFCEIFKIEFI